MTSLHSAAVMVALDVGGLERQVLLDQA